MSGSKKIAVVLIILLALCAGAYFLGLPMLEAQQGKKIAAALARLPGNFTAEEIKVGFFDKKVIIKGLKGKPEIAGGDITYDLNVAQMEVEGANLEAGSRPGVMPLADFVRILDARTASETKVKELDQTFKVTSYCKEMTARGVSGDLTALGRVESLPSLSANASPEEAKAYMDALGSLMTAMATFHLDSFEGLQYRVDVTSPFAMNATVGKVTYSDATILKIGPMLMEDMKVAMFNKEVASLGKVTAKGMSIPNLFSLTLDPQNPQAYTRDMVALFTREPMVIKDLVLENGAITPMTTESITFDSLAYDFEFGAEKVLFTKKAKNFNIPVSVYSQLSRQASMFGSVHQKPLLLNGGANFLVTLKGGSGDVSIKDMQATDSNLGEIRLDAELPFVGNGEGLEGMMENGAEIFVKSASLVLEDKGLSEALLGVQLLELRRRAPDMAGVDVDVLRAGMVQGIQAEAAQATSPDQKLVYEGLAKLLAAPGKLTITINPPQPVNLDDLDEDGNELNARVEYAPAQ